jgi:serine/threonine protein kinase
MELSPGSLVAGYRIEMIVEHDRLGVVYEATQLSLNRTVALRLLPRAFADAAAFRERFRRSAQKQASLDHPHIVSVFDFGESGHDLFIAMRLIRGPNLKELIVARELDAARTLRILTPISDALDTAHEVALIHGGINPQCVVVDRRDHSLLRDFGLSIGPGEVRAADTGAFIGAIDYISPEQIKGETAAVRATCTRWPRCCTSA